VHNAIPVAGPSATKGAVEAVITAAPEDPTEGEGVEQPRIKALEWEHPFTENKTTYTVLFDVQPFWGLDWHGASLFWNGKGPVASFQVLCTNDWTVNAYCGGNTWTLAADQAESKPWFRVVIKVWPDEEEPLFPHREVWSNGVLVSDQRRGEDFFERVGLFADSHIWFLSETHFGATMEGGEKYNHTVPCSTIAVWDHLLTDDEIASLGGVSK
jgi:hypothetical protein